MIEFVAERRETLFAPLSRKIRPTIFDIGLDQLTDFDDFGAMKSEFGTHFIVIKYIKSIQMIPHEMLTVQVSPNPVL